MTEIYIENQNYCNDYKLKEEVRILFKKKTPVTRKKMFLVSTKTRLKKKTFTASKKIGIKKKTFLVSPSVARKGTTRIIPRGYKDKGKYRWVYRWIYKGGKRILFKLKVRNATLMEKKVLFFYANRQIRGGRGENYTTICVQSTYNNTIYTISQSGGKTVGCVSAGMCGFKNTRKSTSYASQVAAKKLSALIKKASRVQIKMRGLGPGKLSGVKTLHKSGVGIVNVRECTPLPHNGCRSAKRRRL